MGIYCNQGKQDSAKVIVKRKIAVVIAAYNSLRSIKGCLDSVYDQKSPVDEVIVIDDGSGDGLFDFIRVNYPDVRIIRNDITQGPAAARNLGIRSAASDWIFDLGFGFCIGPDFVLNFRKFSLSPDTGMVAPKICMASDPLKIFSNGHRLTFLRRFFESRSSKNIFGACSAAAFYNMRMLNEISPEGDYFDPVFFIMAEDVDLAWRARKSGWKIRHCGGCVAFHEGNRSGEQGSKKMFYSIRNRFIMMAKNEKKAYFVLFLMPLLFYEVLRIFFLIIKRYPGIYFRALGSACKAIRGMV